MNGQVLCSPLDTYTWHIIPQETCPLWQKRQGLTKLVSGRESTSPQTSDFPADISCPLPRRPLLTQASPAAPHLPRSVLFGSRKAAACYLGPCNYPPASPSHVSLQILFFLSYSLRSLQSGRLEDNQRSLHSSGSSLTKSQERVQIPEPTPATPRPHSPSWSQWSLLMGESFVTRKCHFAPSETVYLGCSKVRKAGPQAPRCRRKATQQLFNWKPDPKFPTKQRNSHPSAYLVWVASSASKWYVILWRCWLDNEWQFSMTSERLRCGRDCC